MEGRPLLEYQITIPQSAGPLDLGGSVLIGSLGSHAPRNVSRARNAPHRRPERTTERQCANSPRWHRVARRAADAELAG